MAVLTLQTITKAGIVPSFVAAAGGGDHVPNSNGRSYLHVKNGGGGAIDVTLDSVQQCSFGFDHNLVVNVGAGAEKIIGPFEAGRFNDANQRVAVTYSGVSSVTVAAFEV